MAYCTQQNLIDRFGEMEMIQYTDRDGSGVINSLVLNQAIADADAEINAYLSAYTLPLAVIPAHLVSIACDIVRYRLCSNQIIEPIAERYKAALRYLEQVAKGTISLGPDAAGVAPDAATGAGIEFASATSVFGRDALSSF